MKSLVFQIFNDFLHDSTQFKGKSYLKKTKKTGEEPKNYFLIKLAKSKENLFILGERWSMEENHISIYEDIDRLEKNYQSTYHYTGMFSCNNQTLKIHSYFNRNGIYQYSHIKKDATHIPIESGHEKIIQSYVESVSIQLISHIDNEACAIVTGLATVFENSLRQLSQVSSDFDNIVAIEKYLECSKICQEQITLLTQYDPSKKSIQKHLENTYEYLSKKLWELKYTRKNENNSNIKKNKSKQEINTTQNPHPILSMDSEHDYHNEELSLVEDPILKLLQRYSLLQKKVKLIDENNFNQLIQCFNALNSVELEIRHTFMACARKGELQSVIALSPYISNIPVALYFECIKEGYSDLVIFLITHFKPNLNLYGNRKFVNGMCPGDNMMHVCVRFKQYSILEFLLLNKANPNIRALLTGATALILAVNENLPRFVELLLKQGADPNLSSQNQEWLAITTNIQLAQSLKSFTSTPNLEYTPLHFACINRHLEIIKLLLEYNANIFARSKDDLTPAMLLLAVNKRPIFYEGIELFLAKGLDINEPHREFKYSALYFACQQEREQDVRFLIERGADPNLSQLTLDSAIRGAVNLSAYFIGEEPIMFTPLMKAAQKGNISILRYLLNQTNQPVTTTNIFNTYMLAQLSKQYAAIHLMEDIAKEALELTKINKFNRI